MFSDISFGSRAKSMRQESVPDYRSEIRRFRDPEPLGPIIRQELRKPAMWLAIAGPLLLSLGVIMLLVQIQTNTEELRHSRHQIQTLTDALVQTKDHARESKTEIMGLKSDVSKLKRDVVKVEHRP